MAQKIDRRVLEQRILEVEGLSSEERSALLELLHTKKYGLVWEDKPEDVEERLRESLPILIEDKKLALAKGGENAPNHILIEGDNLEALTVLTYTHEGMIDVIYIDPPYNTGNKDFVYNDKFVDSEDEYRHSKWLSFMNKRLKIAKRLLSDRGVIFISIDDNEQANLKLLCDEVFGERNHVATFDWRRKTGSNDAKDIAVVTENILLFSKNHQNTLEPNIWSRDESSVNKGRYRYSDEYVETRGMFYYDTLDRGGLQYSDSMNYGITAPDGGVIFPNGRDKFFNDGWIWKWGQEKVKWGLENGFLVFEKSNKSKGSAYTIKYKVYENVDNEGNIREEIGRAYSNLILEPINQQGKSDISSIFGGISPFSNPKPNRLIQYLEKTISNKNYTILDFFAGSGTTLHATMQLNAEDGGNRRCILVTNNENNICRDVTYERNKRVIQGYTTPKGADVEGLKANNLRYYKIDYVERERSLTAMRKLMSASTELLCIKHDIYQESHTFGDLKLRKHISRYFDDGKQKMLVIYKVEAIEYLVQEIAKMPEGTNIMTYVFSLNNYAMDADFEDVADKVTLCALPAAIYNAYMRVLPKKNVAAAEEEPEEKPQEELSLIEEEDEK